MGDSVNFSDHKSIKYLLILIAVFFILLSSCSQQNVLVVTDPYIKILEGDFWGPLNRIFIYKSFLSGFKIKGIQAEPGLELSQILLNTSETPEIVIISPWNIQFLDGIKDFDGRIIVAGAYLPTNLQEGNQYRLSAVAPDRSSVMKQIGELSLEIASHTEKPVVALFNPLTDIQKKEMGFLLQAFEGNDLLIFRDISEGNDGAVQLPDDFTQICNQASLLLLFAGTINISALSITDDSQIPVITESLSSSTAWYNRIVASIEANPKELRAALLSEMRVESHEGIRIYPEKLSKGVLFGFESR